MPNNITLTELEHDLLTELFNVGVGNAASALSTMVNQEILLSVPEIKILPTRELAWKLGLENLICSVSQKMTGAFSAQSMLLFPEEDTPEIIRQLLGKNIPEDSIQELQKEAFSEIGNIVLNACIGSFSNAVNKEFNIDLPVFLSGNPNEIFQSEEIDTETALFMRINLTLKNSEITGYMAFLMGSDSLENLKAILDNFLKKL